MPLYCLFDPEEHSSRHREPRSRVAIQSKVHWIVLSAFALLAMTKQKTWIAATSAAMTGRGLC
jgi:hypothetical protein